MLQERFQVHFNQVGQLAECRAWSATYLRYPAESHPELKPHLLAAADLYEAEHDLMWKVWAQTGGLQAPDPVRFADPAVRSAIAAMILQGRGLNERAASHLEAALDQ